MKIELTSKQRNKIAAMFSAIDDVSKDKKIIEQIKFVCSKDFDEVIAVRNGTLNDDNENDYHTLVNLYDDLRDSSDKFNFWED